MREEERKTITYMCWYCMCKHEMIHVTRHNPRYGYPMYDTEQIIPVGDEHLFAYGRVRPSSKKLSIWQNKHGVSRRIADMNEAQLTEAIEAINKGYKCFGQRSKIISLEKALERRRNV